RSYLDWRFDKDPPGYCDAPKYLKDGPNETGQNTLKSQVQEGVGRPYRTVSQWRIAPNMNESLFGFSSDIWIVVPRGSRPRLPTFPLYRPASTDDLIRALRSTYGYATVKGGRTSHVKLKASGRPTLILPGGRKDLSPIVLKNTAHALGFRDPGDLLT